MEFQFNNELFENSAKLSDTEFKDLLNRLLKPILQSRFKDNYQKQQIRNNHNRITFACPYCGDSMQSSHKKRGNIILSGKHRNFYKCHNCGEFHRIDKFFKDHSTELSLNVLEYITENVGDFSNSSNTSYDTTLLFDTDVVEEYAIDRQELKNKFNLMEITDSPVWSWLNSRLQYNKDTFLYSPLKNYIAILNLTPNDKILGLQRRNLKYSKEDSKYLTFQNSTLHELLKHNINKNDEIDSFSQIFGLFNLNLNRDITLFEGPLDSFLFNNSIANAGINKTLTIDLPLRFWFDDDNIGRKKSIEYIENSNTVFLWGKLKKDYALPNRKKWDLTDLLMYFKKMNINVPNFNHYFSNDPFDILEI